MLTKSVNLRATAATRVGCVRHGVGHQTSFSGRGSRNADEDLRSNILQLNTEGLTANKISVIEQLAYKNKAFIIVLQETHCITADKLVIPNFSLAGSILSRNHGLALFVHERLEWSLVDQSPEQSEIEWLCVDVAGYKIINVYTSTNLHTRDSLQRQSRRCHSDPVKRCNFRKADWKRFCLLTGESVKRLPPPDTPDIERAYQDFCESLLSAAKQCIPCRRRKNYVPCWDKECETLYRSFIGAQWGLPLTEPPRPYSLEYSRRSRIDGRKLSTPSTSRTPAARRGEPSTNLLAGLDAPHTCAPSRQIPSPGNL